jgi:hypothetical protein
VRITDIDRASTRGAIPVLPAHADSAIGLLGALLREVLQKFRAAGEQPNSATSRASGRMRDLESIRESPSEAKCQI